MRLLVQLPGPAYLRLYGSTLRELTARDHEIILTYDRAEKGRDVTASGIENLPGVRVVARIPEAERRLDRSVTQLRLAADYIRYLDPRWATSEYLRRRLDKFMIGSLRPLRWAPSRFRQARSIVRLLVMLERVVPPAANVVDAIAALKVDGVVVSPLIALDDLGRSQTETVKAAQSLNLPVGVAIGSWDHLSTKGVMKVVPDRVFVWNDTQRLEAEKLHFQPVDRVVVTGAQAFDEWFERTPTTSRAEFLELLGLPCAPFVLYVGSSPNIASAEREIAFVREWLERLRSRNEAAFNELGTLIRPHPGNVQAWSSVDVSDLGATIAPRSRPELPMSETDAALYFDSIHHSSAVVGLNTSAILESFVQRRPVLTIRLPRFAETQSGTIHFRYLLPKFGGALLAADSFDEHFQQLAATLDAREDHAARIETFLRSFVRPQGLETRATVLLADAIEDLVFNHP
jgi:hypothetical protein